MLDEYGAADCVPVALDSNLGPGALSTKMIGGGPPQDQIGIVVMPQPTVFGEWGIDVCCNAGGAKVSGVVLVDGSMLYCCEADLSRSVACHTSCCLWSGNDSR